VDHIRVLICRVDDLDEMTEVAAFDVTAIEVNKGAGEQALNELENRTQQTGNAILRLWGIVRFSVNFRANNQGLSSGENP
jgi:hypothetical protein